MIEQIEEIISDNVYDCDRNGQMGVGQAAKKIDDLYAPIIAEKDKVITDLQKKVAELEAEIERRTELLKLQVLKKYENGEDGGEFLGTIAYDFEKETEEFRSPDDARRICWDEYCKANNIPKAPTT